LFVLVNSNSEITDDDELETVAQKHMEGRPNSYVFTKALAELYVDKHRLRRRDANSNRSQEQPEVNSTIVRPAIVYNSSAEPTFGWIDNWNGPAAFAMFIFSGLIRCPDFGFTSKCQVIPVDFVANALLSIPVWRQSRSTSCNALEQSVPVVTLTLGGHIPGIIHDLLRCGERYTRLYPSLYITRPIVVPPVHFETHPLLHRLHVFFSEVLYFYVCDLLLIITGLSSK
jgi:hypothetical protein